MKRTIRLSERDLHRVIKESVTKILNEAVGKNKGWRFHETPHVSVKPGPKYTGTDPKGINYLIYIDGARMFSASLTDSEQRNEFVGAYMNKGTYSRISIYYGRHFGPRVVGKFNTQDEFRKSIGFEDAWRDLNKEQAKENVMSIVPNAYFSNNNEFITIECHGGLTPENAPYIIQKCVEGLITPITKDKRKQTDEVTFYDVYDNEEKTMTVKEAYRYAVSAYKHICKYGWGEDVGKPNEYASIEDCLSEYAEVLTGIRRNEEEPPMDWYEMNDRGYFDTFD